MPACRCMPAPALLRLPAHLTRVVPTKKGPKCCTDAICRGGHGVGAALACAPHPPWQPWHRQRSRSGGPPSPWRMRAGAGVRRCGQPVACGRAVQLPPVRTCAVQLPPVRTCAVQLPPVRACAVQLPPVRACAVQLPPVRTCAVQLPPVRACCAAATGEDSPPLSLLCCACVDVPHDLRPVGVPSKLVAHVGMLRSCHLWGWAPAAILCLCEGIYRATFLLRACDLSSTCNLCYLSNVCVCVRARVFVCVHVCLCVCVCTCVCEHMCAYVCLCMCVCVCV